VVSERVSEEEDEDCTSIFLITPEAKMKGEKMGIETTFKMNPPFVPRSRGGSGGFRILFRNALFVPVSNVYMVWRLTYKREDAYPNQSFRGGIPLGGETSGDL